MRIDLALGMPCDKKVGPFEDMFLPDYLSSNFAVSELEGKNLVEKSEILLPAPSVQMVNPFFIPKTVFWILFTSVLIIGFL